MKTRRLIFSLLMCGMLGACGTFGPAELLELQQRDQDAHGCGEAYNSLSPGDAGYKIGCSFG